MLNPIISQITVYETYKCSIYDYDEDDALDEESATSDEPEQAFIEANRRAFSRIEFSHDSINIKKIRVYKLGDRVIFEEDILEFSRQEVNAIYSKFRDEIIILDQQRRALIKADELKRMQEWKENNEKREMELFKTLQTKYGKNINCTHGQKEWLNERWN